MTDYSKLKRLADAAPMAMTMTNGGEEHKALTAFTDEVKRLFGNDVGMARVLIAEIETLHFSISQNTAYQKTTSLRIDALKSGERFYYTGRPCINDHYSPRYTSHGTCVSCKQEASTLPSSQEHRIKAQSRSKQGSKNNYQRWNQEDDRTLISLNNDGLTDEKIALSMGRTLHAVHARRLRLGVGKQFRSNEVGDNS